MNDLERLYEIEEEAINYYLEKTGFDSVQWMTEEERKEYIKLYKRLNGSCPDCGESNCKH